MNSPISVKGIESKIDNLPKKKKKNEVQIHSLVNSTKHLKKEYQFSTISCKEKRKYFLSV